MRCNHNRRGRVADGDGLVAKRLLLACAIALASLCCLPAFALGQSLHAYESTFGERGTGDSQLSEPDGVAVNEASGDVYVVDRGNNRVERFGPNGEFISVWGYGVQNGAKEGQVCTSGCQAGLPGLGKGLETFHINKGEMISPSAIAIDNDPSSPSVGDVYVVVASALEKSYVDKFGPNGEFLHHLTTKAEGEEGERPAGVAVGADGDVWVEWSGDSTFTRFNDEAVNRRIKVKNAESKSEKEEPFDSEVEPTRGAFAVDAEDNIYTNYEPSEIFEEAGEEGRYEEEGRGPNGEYPCEQARCYTAKLRGVEGAGGQAPGSLLDERFNSQNTSGIAVNLHDGDVYVDNLTSVAVYAPDGTLVQRIGDEQGVEGLHRGAGVAVDAATGTVYVADAHADHIDVYRSEPDSLPHALTVANLASSSAELRAVIDPAGERTTASFEYGTSRCSEGGCTTVALPGYVGASSGQSESSTEIAVGVALSGLEPDTTYHYRALAANASANAPLVSVEGTFTTPVTPFALADGRQWELVSPPEKHGASIEAITKEGGIIEAAANGDALTYVETGPDEADVQGVRSPEYTQILARRVLGEDGQPEWNSKDITTANESAPGVDEQSSDEYKFFTPETLSVALLRPVVAEPLLSSEASELTPYLRDNEACETSATSCFKPLVTAKEGVANALKGFGGKTITGGVQFVDADADLKQVLLESEAPLTSEAAAPGGNLYVWNEGKLELANVLPENGGPQEAAQFGQQDDDVRGALSDEGRRVVWTAAHTGGAGRLYMRDMATHETIRLDTPQGGSATGEGQAKFQAANEAGTRVFFLDTERLTPVSTATTLEPDLYACDIVEHQGALECRLEDLTAATASGGESADVVGVLPGVNEQGTTVYLVANGVLSGAGANAQGETASPGNCKLDESEATEATCNLYVESSDGSGWEAPRFVAKLSNADEPDWGADVGGTNGQLFKLTAGISPNGEYLAFMSERSLTGYDNLDVNTGEADEEVYLYQASTGKLVCASCDPTGAPPTGIDDAAVEAGGPRGGLLVDRPGVWQLGGESGHMLAASLPGWTGIGNARAVYRSRYLSNSGRLFFDSEDALVPADHNGKEDVYEYEPGGVGSCTGEPGCVSLISSGSSEAESAFLDASANGNDVFFITTSPLVAAAQEDSGFNVYDARVCEPGGCVSSTTSTTNPCASSEQCKGEYTSTVSAFSPPATGAPSSSGNLPAPAPSGGVAASKATKTVTLTRAQKLAKALKACKRDKRKKKRLACEKQARKQYGPKQTKKKSAKSSSVTGKLATDGRRS